MTQGESKLSREIQNAIRARGGFCFKVHGGPLTMAGVTDIVGCYRGKSLWLETKMPEGDDPTPIQRRRHQQIRAAQGIAVVVRSVADAHAVMDAIDRSEDI